MSGYTDEMLLELQQAAKPLMDFLENHHPPHTKAIVDIRRVEVVETSANIFREGCAMWELNHRDRET